MHLRTAYTRERSPTTGSPRRSRKTSPYHPPVLGQADSGFQDALTPSGQSEAVTSRAVSSGQRAYASKPVQPRSVPSVPIAFPFERPLSVDSSPYEVAAACGFPRSSAGATSNLAAPGGGENASRWT